MVDYKYDVMMTLRMPTELRNRLKEVAEREGRTVSKVALRAIEIGLAEMNAHVHTGGEMALRGAEFEKAVTAILIAHGLLAGSSPETVKIPSKTLGTKQPTKHRKAG